MRVNQVHATATLPSGAERLIDIEVMEPLSFHGIARRVELEARHPLRLADGTVSCAAGTPMDSVRLEEKAAFATISSPDITVRDVEVRCEDLALGAPVVSSHSWHDPLLPRGWSTERDVRLFGRPGGGAFVTATPFVASADTQVPGWVHIVSRSPTASVEGWVARGDVEWTERSPLRGTGESGCGCGCGGLVLAGIGCLGQGCAKLGVDDLGYTGRAEVLADTTVYAEPGHGAWATLTKEETLAVHLEKHALWVAITSTPWVSDIVGPGCHCDDIKRAYVARDRVKFPPQ